MKFPTTAWAARLLRIGVATAVIGALPHVTASAQTAAAPQALSNGASVGPFSDAYQSKRYYSFTLPAGVTAASFSITGTSGVSTGP